MHTGKLPIGIQNSSQGNSGKDKYNTSTDSRKSIYYIIVTTSKRNTTSNADIYNGGDKNLNAFSLEKTENKRGNTSNVDSMIICCSLYKPLQAKDKGFVKSDIENNENRCKSNNSYVSPVRGIQDDTFLYPMTITN
ncbi:hypothetical protein JCM12825_16740 [Desulfurobacterium crinifex]